MRVEEKRSRRKERRMIRKYSLALRSGQKRILTPWVEDESHGGVYPMLITGLLVVNGPLPGLKETQT